MTHKILLAAALWAALWPTATQSQGVCLAALQSSPFISVRVCVRSSNSALMWLTCTFRPLRAELNDSGTFCSHMRRQLWR